MILTKLGKLPNAFGLLTTTVVALRLLHTSRYLMKFSDYMYFSSNSLLSHCFFQFRTTQMQLTMYKSARRFILTKCQLYLCGSFRYFPFQCGKLLIWQFFPDDPSLLLSILVKRTFAELSISCKHKVHDVQLWLQSCGLERVIALRVNF